MGFGPLLEDKLCLIFKLAPSVCRMTFPILASLLVRLVVLLPFQLLRLSLATPSRWTPLALSVFLHCVVARSEERFSRNAETDLVCRLLLEKKTTTCAVIFENRVNQEDDFAGVMESPRAGAISPTIAIGERVVCKEIGSREWDRTTDHLHVKEVLYH